MTPAQLHALVEEHNLATGPGPGQGGDDFGPDEPGLYSTPDGLARLSQMNYGG